MRKVIQSLHLLLLSALLIQTSSVDAQKLPSVQKVSVRAPDKVKTDGKAGEWGDQLQAYNKATGIYYTLANDDDKLYLTINAKSIEIIKKIMAGSITFLVNKQGSKKNTEGVAVTFPLLDIPGRGKIGKYLNYAAASSDGSNPDTPADSIVYIINDILATKSKEIKIMGSKLLTDTLVSVYNDLGIKQGMRFDAKKEFTCELAIPLKYFALDIKDKSGFTYNITLNGLAATTMVIHTYLRGEPITVTGYPSGYSNLGSLPSQAMNSPTDFWGEYVLSGK